MSWGKAYKENGEWVVVGITDVGQLEEGEYIYKRDTYSVSSLLPDTPIYASHNDFVAGNNIAFDYLCAGSLVKEVTQYLKSHKVKPSNENIDTVCNELLATVDWQDLLGVLDNEFEEEFEYLKKVLDN